MIGLLHASVVTLLTVALALPADATVLCRKRSGRVVAAERCGRRTIPTTLADLGVTGREGPAGPPGIAGPNRQLPLRIVDATGRDVCLVTDTVLALACVLAHPALSRPVLLAFRELPLLAGPDTVYYLQADCAGTPYINLASRPLFPLAALVGSVLYVAVETPATTTAVSFERVESPCGGTPTGRGTCCRPSQGSADPFSAPATPIALETLGIALPIAGVTP